MISVLETAYGAARTVARWIYDRLFPDETHGDVTATWQLGDAKVSAYGHVFTHREMMNLARTAGLELEERVIIDYNHGHVCRWLWTGNLLYIFRRGSRVDSSAPPLTS